MDYLLDVWRSIKHTLRGTILFVRNEHVKKRWEERTKTPWSVGRRYALGRPRLQICRIFPYIAPTLLCTLASPHKQSLTFAHLNPPNPPHSHPSNGMTSGVGSLATQGPGRLHCGVDVTLGQAAEVGCPSHSEGQGVGTRNPRGPTHPPIWPRGGDSPQPHMQPGKPTPPPLRPTHPRTHPISPSGIFCD